MYKDTLYKLHSINVPLYGQYAISILNLPESPPPLYFIIPAQTKRHRPRGIQTVLHT